MQSDAGHGAAIITQPDPPLTLTESTSFRTATSIGLSWSVGESGGRRLSTYNNGGSEILDYRVL